MAEDKKKQAFRLVNLSDYQTPHIKEDYEGDFVHWGLLDNNDYFESVINLKLNSPTNATCINGIVDMIYGRGLDSLNRKEYPKQYVQFKRLIRPSEVKKTANDYYSLGMAVNQISFNKAKSKVLKVSHFPMETLRAGKANKKGEITHWYYHPNWSKYKKGDKLKKIPAFGFGTKSELNELYIFKPYSPKFYYYSPAVYHSCLQYAELESEVSEYHISNIQNGLAPSLFINFNNGVPDDQTQQLIENKINEKFSGSSNSGKAMIAFNDDRESQATIDPIHLPDAHAQYQFLSDEAREKIMLGHRVVSPILLGIKDNTGFGNNAEELRTASVLMDNVVVRPRQDELIAGFKEILEYNGIYQQLYFVTLQPIEFTELDNISTKIRKEEETGEKLSAHSCDDDKCDFSEEEGDDLYYQLEGLGEVLSDDWECIYTEIYDEGKSPLKMADIKYEDSNSKEDNDIYKIRYAYMPVRNSGGSRKFCKKMESLTSKKVVFRKEDINMMSFRGVNKEHGHKGRNYSLLKWCGGRNCHHYWELRVYRKKGGKQINPSDAYADGLIEPNNPPEMSVPNIERPDKGAYPSVLKGIRKLFGYE